MTAKSRKIVEEQRRAENFITALKSSHAFGFTRDYEPENWPGTINLYQDELARDTLKRR